MDKFWKRVLVRREPLQAGLLQQLAIASTELQCCLFIFITRCLAFRELVTPFGQQQINALEDFCWAQPLVEQH